MVQFNTKKGGMSFSCTPEEMETLYLVLKASSLPEREQFLVAFTDFVGEDIETIMGKDFPLLKGTHPTMSEYAFHYKVALNACEGGFADDEILDKKKIHAIKAIRTVGTEAIQEAENEGMSVPQGSLSLAAAKNAVEAYAKAKGWEWTQPWSVYPSNDYTSLYGSPVYESYQNKNSQF